MKCIFTKENRFFISKILLIILVALLNISGCNRKQYNFDEQISNVKSIVDYLKNDGNPIDDFPTVMFGSYPQSDTNGKIKEPIEWIVLQKDYTNNTASLISKYILDCKCYNDVRENTTWETCSLRKWLNNEFYNLAFSNEEKKRIVSKIRVNEKNYEFGIDGGNSTEDNVFLLSYNGVRNFVSIINSIKIFKLDLRETVATSYVDDENPVLSWWVSTPGRYQHTAMFVYNESYEPGYGDSVCDNPFGVRPVICVSFE